MKPNDQLLLEKAYDQITNKKPTTFGDLQKLIQSIKLKFKGKQIIDKATGIIIDQAIGLIPGGSNVKTAFEFFKTIFHKPDQNKTGTIIDKLDVDDQIAKIIDDSVEVKFIEHILQLIQKYPPTQTIPENWSMNTELKNFLQQTYKGRTITIP